MKEGCTITRIPLRPWSHALTVEGKMVYSESYGGWNVIKLKKNVLDEFRDLREKDAKIGYKIIIPRSVTELREIIERLKDKEEGLPLLFFFYKVS